MYTQDSVSILGSQMKRMPPSIRETLMVAAYLGSEFDQELLDQAVRHSGSQTESLRFLVERDFLTVHPTSGNFRFVHDKIQQAAMSLIHKVDRGIFSTIVGKRLLEHRIKENQSHSKVSIFLLANLFSRGIAEGILNENAERKKVAVLFLEAGEAAAGMSDFATAATYLDLGITCLSQNYLNADNENGYWKNDYELSLAIYNMAAEVEYCTANFERMDRLIKEILVNARSFLDKMRAYSTMIYSLGSRMRLFEAIALGFSLLEVLGESFPAKDYKVLLVLDLLKTKRMTKCFDGDLQTLRLMNDERKEAAMQILNLIFPYCLMLKHPKAPFAIFRMVQLSMRYGFTATSATGFAGYGLILCGIRDFRNGNRNGKIALRLVDHFDATQLISRVYAIYYGFISNWNTPLAMNLEGTMNGHKLGLSSGDIEFGMVNATLFATNSFHAGQPLDTIVAEIEKLHELTILFRLKSVVVVISPILQQIHNLRSSDPKTVPWILSGPSCDEDVLLKEAKASNNVMCLSQFYFRKLWMAYVFHNYDLAFEMAEKSRVTIQSSPASFMVFSHHFLEGMACLALARCPKTSKKKKQTYLRLAKKCLSVMKKHSNHCKSNCLNKVLLVEAESKLGAGGRCDLSGALELFEKSASIAKEEDLVHERAIAYERAGLAVLWCSPKSKSKSNTAMSSSSSLSAERYFRKSMSLFRSWGATLKVEHMKRQYGIEDNVE